MEMNLKGQIVEEMSKQGKPYKCLKLELTPTYTKKIFLDEAELQLIEFSKTFDKKDNK